MRQVTRFSRRSRAEEKKPPKKKTPAGIIRGACGGGERNRMLNKNLESAKEKLYVGRGGLIEIMKGDKKIPGGGGEIFEEKRTVEHKNF